MYVYLDESGDTGSKFRRGGSSRYFTLALLLVDDPIPLHQAVHDLRLHLGLPENYEFKFGSTGHGYRLAFFQAIRPYAFEMHSLVIDKQIPEVVRSGGKAATYEYLVGLIMTDQRETLMGRTLVIDESVQNKEAKARLVTAVRNALGSHEGSGERVVKHIVFHRSHQDNLIQVTDMAVGAVARAYERGDAQYVRLLGRKLRVVHYPGMEPGGPTR